MTYLVNDPATFAAEVLGGFARAHSDRVRAVPGGVVRAVPAERPQVAIVLGGGSGHYPAFAGWVGAGMADGVVCGNIFASPSADQACAVIRAAHHGAGVLLGFGNYAGDVLQFGQAAEELRAEGIDVRIVAVTDDIASDPEPQLRRGIAGDLLVFKIAGAAAAAGADLDTVERVARRANDHTRTIGVALSGCTLPGQAEPLFSVPDGEIALGLGIHGEPGLSTRPLGTAAQVADDLVDRLLAELPEGAERVAVLVNGLGATTHEELYAVYAHVADRLEDRGLTIVAPEVGEHVTSLDMAGLSVTVTYLDEDLERWWLAPADTPAFRRGQLAAAGEAALAGARAAVPVRASAAGDDQATGSSPAAAANAGADARTGVPIAGPSSRAAARRVLEVGALVAGRLADDQDELGRLDAIAGDGDHGQGMVLGIRGALQAGTIACQQGAGLGTVLSAAGRAWSNAAGGTSGALWGAGLRAVGDHLGDVVGPGANTVAEGLELGVAAIMALGRAQPGDKTLVDVAVPFARDFRSAVDRREPLATAWTAAAAAAQHGATSTAALTARIGRSRTHGERSRGHPDPGAVSFALVVAVIAAEAVARAEKS